MKNLIQDSHSNSAPSEWKSRALLLDQPAQWNYSKPFHFCYSVQLTIQLLFNIIFSSSRP
jgi:hypothetical protein